MKNISVILAVLMFMNINSYADLSGVLEIEEKKLVSKAEIERLRKELENSKNALQERLNKEQEEEVKERVSKAEGILKAWKETLGPEELTAEEQILKLFVIIF